MPIPEGHGDLYANVEMDRPVREAGIALASIGAVLFVNAGLMIGVADVNSAGYSFIGMGASSVIAGIVMIVLDRRPRPIATLTSHSGSE